MYIGITMKNPEKHVNGQMSLAGLDEWSYDLTARGADVFCKQSGKVRQEWLSLCKEERALTKDLMARVVEPSNLVAALRQVVSNKGSAGVDGMSVKELQDWFSSNWGLLQHQLLSGTYRVSAVREVQIPKPSGGHRILGIPTVKDRLVQQAINQVLSRRYEPVFSEHSYGFRPNRSAKDALREAGEYVANGRDWVVDIDLEKFFDTVNHHRLIWLLGTRIGDKVLLRLISRFLRVGMLKEACKSTDKRDTSRQSTIAFIVPYCFG